MNRHALKATDFKSVVSAYSTTRAGAVPYASGYGREHSLYIPRALCGATKVRILVSRGAGRFIGEPGASHAAQTVVFTHTGES